MTSACACARMNMAQVGKSAGGVCMQGCAGGRVMMDERGERRKGMIRGERREGMRQVVT